eukprot:1779455-Pleurochrysis_carterae.AAC.1
MVDRRWSEAIRAAFHLCLTRWYSSRFDDESAIGSSESPTPTIHGCLSNASASNRFFGSCCSSARIKSFALAETLSHASWSKLNAPSWMQARICASVRPGASNGWRPERMM